MYVYLEPQGGFNDVMVLVNIVLDYCNKYNRILLINGIIVEILIGILYYNKMINILIYLFLIKG
jgi:hypothetical protein